MQMVLEKQESLANLRDTATREGQNRIQREDGRVFLLQAEYSSKSALDVPGVDMGISTQEWIDVIREERERR